MNEKDIRFKNIIMAFCPPIIYLFITMFVEVVADIIIFVRQAKSTSNSNSFISSYKFMDNITDNLDKYSYLITFISAAIAIFIFGYYYFRHKNTYEAYKLSKVFTSLKVNDYFNLVIIGAIGSVGLSRFVSMLPLDNIIGNYENTSNALLSGNIILQIVSLGIVVPIAEELIYRGLLFNGLTKVIDAKYAIFVASLVFGVFHYNLLQGTYTFLLSLILICVYMKYKCILAPIIIHACANIVAVISSYFGISSFLNRNIWIYLLIMVVELVIGVISFEVIMKEDLK